MKPKIVVEDCSVGRGVFATEGFRRGDLILNLRGFRVDRNDPVHATPDACFLLQTGRATYVRLSEPGVLVNHSCEPNAGIVANRRLVAIEDIGPGEEIRFDYSTTMDDDMWTMECSCGEIGCRSLIEDFKKLPTTVRQRYLDLGVVPGFIARQYRPARLASAM